MPYYHVPHYCGIYYLPPVTIINVYPPPKPSWLPQVSLSTVSKLQDTASRTVLTQTFLNPSSSTITKAKYNFPLYESCAVVSFRCFVGKRFIEGVVKEKEQAKAEYKQAVDRGETAGLLEQHRPDVFSTSIGNIPAGETVKVEIEYIMELKHDAEADGLRFTIPTSIAPRYGDAPSGLDAYPGATAQGGMKIVVQVTMPSNIRSMQSPSHPLAVELGGHVENVSDDAFNPKHALATLSQTSAELGSDFVLIVKCADLSSPRALLETHATIPHSKALMVTLVPKFTLPVGQKPEIVFVVDRSGSMGSRITPLKSALGVFLKSLPLGVKFNICSFGSKHSFLWKKSQTYSAETLEQAQRHVDGIRADFGGTEILPPIKSTISQRYKDLALEIMVLTDGEVWNSEDLFAFIAQATQKGDVRLFSLGIGRDVSHALVEGMARVGRGFAQIVADEKEGIEGKVVRMLKGALSAHIHDYRLEWEGKPSEVDMGSSKHKSNPATTTAAKKKINLFDTKADTDAAISFSKLPDFIVPSVLPAPYKLPPLFPFSRTTAYVILSGAVSPPPCVWLRGTTPSGDELELEITVQPLPEPDQTIHQLAARKILQELEEGFGYLHSGKFGVDKEADPGTFGDWVQREGVRVGVKYGLASKWTSFVAVQKKEKEASQDKEEGSKGKQASKDKQDAEVESMTGDDDFDFVGAEDEEEALYPQEDSPVRPRSARSSLATVGSAASPAPGAIATAPSSKVAANASFFSRKLGGVSPRSSSSVNRTASLDATPSRVANTPVSAITGASFSLEKTKTSRQARVGSAQPPPPPPPAARSNPLGAMRERADVRLSPVSAMAERKKTLKEGGPSPKPPAIASSLGQSGLGDRQRTMALIGLQTFEGSFSLTTKLAELLGLQWASLEGKSQELTSIAARGSAVLSQDQMRCLFATLLVVAVFERKFAADREVWELVVDKAKAWVASLVKDDELGVKVEGLVQEALAQAQF